MVIKKEDESTEIAVNQEKGKARKAKKDGRTTKRKEGSNINWNSVHYRKEKPR